MSFIYTIIDQSKKVGRILGFMVTLGITGTLSILQNIYPNTVSQATIDDWMKLTMICMTFYYLSTKGGEVK